MWQAQRTAWGQGKTPKGEAYLEHVSFWAYGEYPYDCHPGGWRATEERGFVNDDMIRT